MTSFNDDFTLDNIDEQLEQSSRRISELPAEQHNASNVRLMQDLQRLYQHDPEDARAIDRVRARLIEKTEERERQEQVTFIMPRSLHQQREVAAPGPIKQWRKKKETMNRKLVMLAAILVVGVLVGSMTVVVTMAQQAQKLAQSPTTQTGATSSDNIYTARGYALLKLDGTAHKDLWNYPIETKSSDPPFQDPLIVADGSVYVTTYNDDVYSIDSTTGKQRWASKQNDATGLVVADGLVFLKRMQAKPEGPYTLYSLNASDGKPNRTYTFKDVRPVGEPFFAVANQVLYVGVDHHLFALNARTGEQLWHSTIIEQERITSLAIEKETLYINTASASINNGQISHFEYGFSLDQGAQAWRHRLPVPAELLILTAPHLVNGILYYSYEGRVFAWNASKGTVLWDYEQEGSFRNVMHIANDVVYVGEFAQPEKITALNATTGKQLWQVGVKGIPGSLRTGGEKIYVDVTSRETGVTLYELNVNDGSVLWEHVLDEENPTTVPLTVAP